ncbi:TIGR02680 family protein [Georgenia sp. SYP-B2076]|uniref:TIGR02680 family protein n=1 Tax=Georgenia sp. SYP-B2076 TaxID=2495881 RepID=UPI000F8ECB82|nr:TIGR02680 family protein [Georgenia sp. SYP-B2076]
MSATTTPTATPEGAPGAAEDQVKHHPHRWRLHRAGIVNVWHYWAETFQFSGGRMVLRGTNGSGKSRALEMLLPFVLDADRRRMDSTGSGKVRLDELMKVGAEGQGNRLGYLWAELVRDGETGREHLTLGALVRWSASSGEAKVWYFTTPLRVGHELELLDVARQPMSRERLTELVGADRITENPETHRERVRSVVFGLTGPGARERYDGLLQLIRTLRSPDVGNRIEEGNLPRILSDALPPLSEETLNDAGGRLDDLSESRESQRRLAAALEHVTAFLGTYSRYAATELGATADRAGRAADAGREATEAAQAAAADRDDLAARSAGARATVEGLETREGELAATAAGLKDSDAYRAGQDLAGRNRHVSTLAQLARRELDSARAARQVEADAVAAADQLGTEAIEAAREAAHVLDDARAGLRGAHLATTTLPASVEARLVPVPAPAEPVRVSLEDEPTAHERPSAQQLMVTPTDLEEAAARAGEVAAAAQARAGEAGNRHQGAVELARARTAADHVEDAAGEAAERRDADETVAGERGQDRDAAARELAAAWRAWTAQPRTAELLGDVGWAATAVGPLLFDVDVLGGDISGARDGAPRLDELDRVAAEAADAARDRLARTGAALDAEADADGARRRALTDEQRELRAAKDPEPPAAPWARALTGGAQPLWRAVDFADGLSAADRAGLEAALLSAGLLGAGLSVDGALVAEDGQTLLTAASSPAPQPLRAALVPDPAATVPAAIVSAVLARIGLGAGSHTTWVDVDGSWGNGPLRGRRAADTARHIGAAARAAARTARLARIEDELAALDERAADRAGARDRLVAARADLTGHVRTAPTTAALAQARTLAVAAARQAARTRAEAARLAERSAELRAAWKAQEATHRTLCDRHELPLDADGLQEVRDTAQAAQRACRGAASALTTLARARSRHAEEVARLDGHRVRRAEAELGADAAWAQWHREAAEVEALTESLGQEAREVHRRLAETEEEHRRVARELADARRGAQQLGEKEAVARRDAETAEAAAAAAGEHLTGVLGRLRRQLALPGVVAAATGRADLDLLPAGTTGQAVTPELVRAAAGAVRGAVAGAGSADLNVLMRAQQKLEAELQGGFDVVHTVAEDLHLVELVDTTGRSPVAEAAADLRARVERAREALTSREHEVFTNFVVGGVGEELRRRLAQSDHLVAAMNDSLRSISTSHGIGVRLAWVLDAPEGSRVHRIKELVQAASAVRPGERTDELITLLREQVEEQFALDETAGYAQHLKNALDYRAWHHMRVTILGPGPHDRRELRGRAKLSQGETRFVSYVTLFAAADAYLSGLGDTALRLVLLDDAFAKVDDPTIGELMGLLVRLDLDFCMTAHNLWVTYPQVPCADEYEILRAEGTPAVAVHTHWDGRTRHLAI